MGKQEKTISADRAHEQMKRACARKEYCAYDIRRKLERMNLPEGVAEGIIRGLKEERYIDEERYIRSFISDKVRFNKWGRKKIEFALLQKQLPRQAVEKAFSEYRDGELSRSLPALLERKWASVTGNSLYEKESKLIRYALGRGFTMDEITRSLQEMKKNENSDDG